MKCSKDEIKQCIGRFYCEIRDDENARYKSWEHCHQFFIDHKDKKSETIFDLMSLHLAFYLASWGMLRGSSFLLQKSYRVHYEPIRVLLSDKYSVLWRITPENLLEENNMDLLFDCVQNLSDTYENQYKCKKPSDTLITKILMGVFACVPAYDRYLMNALKKCDGIQKFSKNSMIQLCKFWIDNEQAFEESRKELKNDLYTEMKIMDMLFWQMGFDMDSANASGD